ncbi:MAG: tetratricopeptide repeat protein [Bacteroidota bacterium]|nr:tetratricopeptide repeat protein [Bacteroidota bacterium]
MKKISMTFLAAGLFMITGIRAQTVQDGVNDLYAERYKSAKGTFEKLLAANPNNIEATYWLGQTYIAQKDIPGARDIYSKALMASANAPLLIVGMGQVELNEKKLSESTQRFEAAITMTRTKKGDDPVILNAIGRAITNTYTDKEKIGDINYAIEKLEAAALRDPNNGDIFLNLGNAYLKAKPGEGGGKAFENYTKSAQVSPNFAAPCFRLAMLFYSQRNWELYERYLNDAITRDPRFAPAYYELSYYKMRKKDLESAETYAQKFKENSDPDPQNAYLEASIKWASKKFDEAIAMSKDIINQSGGKAKGRVYKLVADAMVQKKDSATARSYIDEYFKRAEPEEITAIDFKLKSDIYSAIPGQEAEVYNTYLEGVKADTVLSDKIDLLTQGAAFFKAKGQREKEGDLTILLLQIKPKPSINDYYNATRAYYFGQAYAKSRDMALKMIEKYPDEQYGYEFAVYNSRVLDSTRKDSIAVPDAIRLFTFSQKDTVKFKKDYLDAAGYLAIYYANDAKDAAKALEYINKMLELDPNNETLKKNKAQLERAAKQSNPRGSNESKSGSSGPASRPATKDSKAG